MLSFRAAQYLVQRETLPGRYWGTVPDCDLVVDSKDYTECVRRSSTPLLKTRHTVVLIVSQVFLAPLHLLERPSVRIRRKLSIESGTRLARLFVNYPS